MAQQIQLRHDTIANFANANPILIPGEVAIELDAVPIRFKVGTDGVTAYNSLPYFTSGSSGGGGGGGAVTSVQGRIGAVTISATDVGLGNVNNTSDAAKNSAPVALTNHTIDGSLNTLLKLPASGITGVIPIANLATGTPNGSKFVRDDGTLASPSGSGTVTHTAGNLTVNSIAIGNGTADLQVIAGFTTDGTSVLQLGVTGTSVGGLKFFNATSGFMNIVPPTGALGSIVLTLPSVTGSDSLVARTSTDTLSNKSLTAPTVTGVSTITGAAIAAGTSMTTVIDFTKPENDLALSSAPTLTVGGSPATGQQTVLRVTGDTVNRVVTLPAGTWRSFTTQGTITSFTVPANSTSYILVIKTAAGFDIVGEPEPLQQRGFCRTQTVGANVTVTLIGKATQAGVINSVSGKTTSGTINLQLTINGVNVTGATCTAATSSATGTASAANAFNAGDTIACVFSGNSGAQNTDVTAAWTPNLL